MNILVAGGAGYIGTHTCVELINNGYEVVIIDNLVNSKRDVVDRIKEITSKDVTFYEGDVRDEKLLINIFEENVIGAVIHFAGLKAVGESVEKPLEYYQNNLDNTHKKKDRFRKGVHCGRHQPDSSLLTNPCCFRFPERRKRQETHSQHPNKHDSCLPDKKAQHLLFEQKKSFHSALW